MNKTEELTKILDWINTFDTPMAEVSEFSRGYKAGLLKVKEKLEKI